VTPARRHGSGAPRSRSREIVFGALDFTRGIWQRAGNLRGENSMSERRFTNQQIDRLL